MMRFSFKKFNVLSLLTGLLTSTNAARPSSRVAAFPKSEPLVGSPAVRRRGVGRDTSIPLPPRAKREKAGANRLFKSMH